MKLVFLHIPKTAGQSVHAALEDAFGQEAMCPARVNDELRKLTITQLNRYQVFSGHFDWSLLDCIKGPKFVFTILREPLDRVLSFYFFLRDEASRLGPEQLGKPQNQGKKAVLTLSARDYFLGGTPQLRRFLDDHYDNFYTYYFAGRHYQARSELQGLIRRGELTLRDVSRMAKDNLSTLSAVYSTGDMPTVFSAIRSLSGSDLDQDKYHRNVNASIAAAERRSRLTELGADAETLARLEEYILLDREIWRMYG